MPDKTGRENSSHKILAIMPQITFFTTSINGEITLQKALKRRFPAFTIYLQRTHNTFLGIIFQVTSQPLIFPKQNVSHRPRGSLKTNPWPPYHDIRV